MVNTIKADEPVVNERLGLAGPMISAGVMSPQPKRPKPTTPTGGQQGISQYGYGQEGYYLETQPKQPEPQSPQDESYVIGVPYFLPFATPYRNAWEVYRDDIVTIRQLNTMRREDGQARALYRLLTMPIRAALKDASFQPRDGESQGQGEADFIKDMLTLPPSMGGMEVSFNRVVAQMLLSIFEGFSAFEMIYWSPEEGPLKGKWTIRKLDWRPAETLTFLLDGSGTWAGFRQRTFFNGRTIDAMIEAKDCVYVAVNEEERPFYGVSMFETAFYHYDKKVKLYYITHLAAQRAAVGTRIGTMPPNPIRADKEMFVNGLKQLGLAQYMIVPNPDWTVTNLKEEGSFDYLGLINHHNSQMSKSVLQAWFDDQQGQGGDTTLVDFGKQSDATAMMLLEAIMDDLKWVIDNKVIPKFIDWNFGTGLYPEFHWGPLTQEQKAAIQDTFDKLALGGQNLAVSKRFMLELEKKMAEEFGFEDIDYDKQIKELEAQEAQEKKIQASQQDLQLAENKFSKSNLQAQQQIAENPAAAAAGGSAGSSAGGSAGAQPQQTAMSNPSMSDDQRLEAMDWLLAEFLAPA